MEPVAPTYGFINKNGKTIVDFKYKKASYFAGGTALAKDKNGYVFINKQGAIILKTGYEICSNFSRMELIWHTILYKINIVSLIKMAKKLFRLFLIMPVCLARV